MHLLLLPFLPLQIKEKKLGASVSLDRENVALTSSNPFVFSCKRSQDLSATPATDYSVPPDFDPTTHPQPL
uniref:Uncharacterized protein n=1 Tax=Anguilla anguilla TaxID=7936 RepID=A0A0E9UT96_ANGAN